MERPAETTSAASDSPNHRRVRPPSRADVSLFRLVRDSASVSRALSQSLSRDGLSICLEMAISPLHRRAVAAEAPALVAQYGVMLQCCFVITQRQRLVRINNT